MSYSRPSEYYELIRGAEYQPYEFFVEQNAITLTQVREYAELVEGNSKEKILDPYVKRNKQIIVNALQFASAGHQGAWVIPQQPINTALRGVDNGFIPDYLVCGKNSDGLNWWVIEFKGANERIFSLGSDNKPAFSPAANKGMMQLLEYVDFCEKHQAILRDQLKLPGFHRPKGMLVIGRDIEIEQNPRLQRLKRAWNNIASPSLEIRTHDALVRLAYQRAEFNEKYGDKGPSLSDFDFSKCNLKNSTDGVGPDSSELDGA